MSSHNASASVQGEDRSNEIEAATADLFHENNPRRLPHYLDLFELVANETRFTILYLLREENGMSAKDLGAALGKTGNSLHYHLDKLVEKGLVVNWKKSDPEKHSAYSFYELSGTGVDLADATAGFIENEKHAIESYENK